ncbi:MAG: hypothetical protein K2L68_02750 [Muribaculaceae bacterium]|nr:hypothetical protein [Muribaculaceae bacterium]
MEKLNNQMSDYNKAIVLLWRHVLDSVGADGILCVDVLIPVAFEEGRLLRLKDFIIEPDSRIPLRYDCAIKLTPECKAYIRKRILDRGDTADFVHYAFYRGERCIMEVYDSICISIDKSVKIPEWLLAECERNEIWVDMEDSIE